MNGKLKIVAYICLNAGVVIWCCIFVLEGMSVTRGFLSLIISLVFVNAIIWSVFKQKKPNTD